MTLKCANIGCQGDTSLSRNSGMKKPSWFGSPTHHDRPSRANDAWLTWNHQGPDTPLLVSSERLQGKVNLPNRTFPKIRSWIALGSPLELLSPLSVARVLVALGVLTIGALVPFTGRSEGQWIWTSVAALLLLVTFVWLAHSKSLSQKAIKLVILSTVISSAAAARGLAPGLPILLPISWTVLSVVTLALFEKPSHVLTTALLVLFATATSTLGTSAETLGVAAGAVAGVISFTLGIVIAFVNQGARRQGTLDAETGLLNGSGLARHLDSLPQDLGYVAVGLVIPGISDVRNALGHEVGTDLLRRVVEDLGQVLPLGTRLGRVAGDDLVAVMSFATETNSLSSSEQVDRLASCLLEAVGAGKYHAGAVDLQLRAHAGTAVDKRREFVVPEVIRRALLSAHRAARHQQLRADWSGESLSMTSDDLVLLDALSKAVHSGEISLVYQPQYEATTRTISGVEALLRWQSPTRGLVSPGVFIPLAERTGLIEEITDVVLNEALDAQVRWRDMGIRLPVAINISARSLSNPHLTAFILEGINERGLSPESLCLEVTETAEATDLAVAIAALTPLHVAGIRVSIDDFGAGYTSLSLLPDLPIDEIKIDQKFVMRMLSSEADRAIVQAVASLGHNLGLTVVAEGVETEAIACAVSAYKCDLLQGYHLAKPMPERALLAHHRDRFGERAESLPRELGVSTNPIPLD